MQLKEFLEMMEHPSQLDWEVTHHEVIPAKKALLEDMPPGLEPVVSNLVSSSGIKHLYSHQAEAIKASLSGRHVVLATSTASGKTLAYQIPVINKLVQEPQSRALFLFPLKALERDQRDAFLALSKPAGLTAAVYDGDTPESQRRKIRKDPPRVLITNPDMLHLSLLAYHDTWKEFFTNLTYVVLDEVHTYKGIFGTHISQVLLRLRRVCDMYGAQPLFFASSATVANPGELVHRLVGAQPIVVDQSGAPTSERHFLFVKSILSPNTIAARLFTKGIEAGLKTIVFTRARKITELITSWVMAEAPQLKNRVSSYRAGFLPEERREIETMLFSGQMDGVISTSALEMGIDVGGLDLCILVGYPGTIINTWQRGGRVGRAGRPSAIVLLAGYDALDQYFLNNPQDFFRRGCEQAVLDPTNKEVLKRHLPCAAAETPLRTEEDWISIPEVASTLEELEQLGVLFKSDKDGAWHSYSRRPHRGVDLRGIGQSFPIFLDNQKTLIGSSSGVRVFTECHEGAVYLHRTKQYVVTKLDMQRKNVIVRPQRLNYYTKALSDKDTEILGTPTDSTDFPGFTVREGRLKVTQTITSYEKRRTSGQDLIAVVDLDLPPIHFETFGIWIEIPDAVKKAIQKQGLHFMGGIHAMEHAAISVFPLFALCDRDDIGGISTPEHEQVCRAAVFIYDGHEGGVGLAHHIFGRIIELLKKTQSLVEACPCESGCPSCIHSPKCGSGNKPLDKQACLKVLTYLLEPKELEKVDQVKKPRENPIFPELVSKSAKSKALRHGQREPIKEKSKGREFASNVSRRKSMNLRPEKVVVFDLETQRLADEVGGWKNISKMGLSLGVTHSLEHGFLTFTESKVDELIALLKEADLIVGFNQMRFDYEVLSAYSEENLRALPNLDILLEVNNILGFRLKLDNLAEATLGKSKSGHGTQAVDWFRAGRMDLLEKYCRDDVEITRDLFRFGIQNRYLLFRSKNGTSSRIPINWDHLGLQSSR